MDSDNKNNLASLIDNIKLFKEKGRGHGKDFTEFITNDKTEETKEPETPDDEFEKSVESGRKAIGSIIDNWDNITGDDPLKQVEGISNILAGASLLLPPPLDVVGSSVLGLVGSLISIFDPQPSNEEVMMNKMLEQIQKLLEKIVSELEEYISRVVDQYQFADISGKFEAARNGINSELSQLQYYSKKESLSARDNESVKDSMLRIKNYADDVSYIEGVMNAQLTADHSEAFAEFSVRYLYYISLLSMMIESAYLIIISIAAKPGGDGDLHHDTLSNKNDFLTYRHNWFNQAKLGPQTTNPNAGVMDKLIKSPHLKYIQLFMKHIDIKPFFYNIYCLKTGGLTYFTKSTDGICKVLVGTGATATDPMNHDKVFYIGNYVDHNQSTQPNISFLIYNVGQGCFLVANGFNLTDCDLLGKGGYRVIQDGDTALWYTIDENGKICTNWSIGGGYTPSFVIDNFSQQKDPERAVLMSPYTPTEYMQPVNFRFDSVIF